MNIDNIALILNTGLTIGLGITVSYYIIIKKLKRHIFYYLWSLGFILYGIQIGIRDLFGTTFPGTILVITAFTLFLAGIWSLNRSKPLMYLTFTIYGASIIMAYLYFSGILELTQSLTLGATINFFPVTIAIIYHRSIFGRTVDKLAIGWISLYLSNILIWEQQWTLNIFAIFFKLVIFLGIIEYDFLIITQKILKNHSKLTPLYTSFENEGGLKLVTLNHTQSKKKIIEWVNKKANENIQKDTSTYIFCFQDTIPYKDLWRIKWINPEKVVVFLFSSSAEKIKDEFEIFPMDLAHIGAATTEIINKCKKHNKKCTIIFLDLSILIHLFGTNSIYTLLLNKMGSLRENQVELFGLMHPETHQASIVSLFKSISDETMEG